MDFSIPRKPSHQVLTGPSEMKEKIDISFSCNCLAIDHEFHHTIFKVAADYFDNAMTKLIVSNWTDT